MHVYTYMATKTISITKAAYDRLKARKGPDESFSDVVLRLTERRPLAEFAGGHELLPFSETDAREAGLLSGQLSRSGEMMGTVDVQIAGMAKARAQTLLASDRRFRGLADAIRIEKYP